MTSKVKCIKCGRKNITIGEQILEEERKSILCPKCKTKEKKLWWN